MAEHAGVAAMGRLGVALRFPIPGNLIAVAAMTVRPSSCCFRSRAALRRLFALSCVVVARQVPALELDVQVRGLQGEYENSLGDSSDTIKLHYDLNDWIELQTETGDSQGGDIFFKFEN